MLAMNTIKKNKAANKKRKRIGRGNASGTGTYSGKGLKGQKARSGVSNLKRLGMKQRLLQTPKLRGFNSQKPKNQIVSIDELNKNYKDGEKVNPETLFEKKLIKKADKPIKILGKEKLKVKLNFENVLMSESVSKQL